MKHGNLLDDFGDGNSLTVLLIYERELKDQWRNKQKMRRLAKFSKYLDYC